MSKIKFEIEIEEKRLKSLKRELERVHEIKLSDVEVVSGMFYLGDGYEYKEVDGRVGLKVKKVT